MIERLGIVAQGPLDEGPIAEADGDEDVEPGAALDEEPHDVRCLPQETLAGMGEA